MAEQNSRSFRIMVDALDDGDVGIITDALDGIRRAGGNPKRWQSVIEPVFEHFKSARKFAENDGANPDKVAEAIGRMARRVIGGGA